MNDIEYRAKQIAAVAREMARLDLVNVVRCKDCKYADETENGLFLCNGYLVESWDWYNDMPNDGREVEPAGFCAWGERRTNDQMETQD